MEGDAYRENDFVWAKLGQYSPWPAIVRKPDASVPPKPYVDSVWVYFLETHDYAWVRQKNVYPYAENKLKFKKARTEAAMQELDEIIELVQTDPNYDIPFVAYQPKVLQNQATPAMNPTPPMPKERNKLTKFGLLASNRYAVDVIKKLIQAKLKLFVCCTAPEHSTAELRKYASMYKTFFKVCSTPAEVVRNADNIISYMRDAHESFSIVTQLTRKGLLENKNFIQMTDMSPTDAEKFAELITRANATYLEAMIQGERQEAYKGEFIILGAGDSDLFRDSQNVFEAIGKASFFIGRVPGKANKLHLAFQMLKGVYLSGLAEGFAMADRWCIKLDALKDILSLTMDTSEYLDQKADLIMSNRFDIPDEPLEKLQQDIAWGLQVADQNKQPMLLASKANEIMKHSRRLGYDNHDSACIYKRNRY